MFVRRIYIEKVITISIALSISGMAQADKGSYLEGDQVPGSGSAVEEKGSILDPEEHPATPEAPSIFPESMIPIDATLSWTERFNGNETFNETEKLGNSPRSMMLASSSPVNQKEGSKDFGNMDSMGTIKSIKAGQEKVKISHGPIDKYGMPAMTMMFKVSDASLLEGLAKGNEVGFTVESTSGGFIITGMVLADDIGMKQKGMTESKPSVSMDAQGTIQQIRLEQGKVKIAHGPIEKYGMPEMTMVFKVSDPSLLDGLENGTDVQFSVDNSSGGFVITAIEAINK